MHTVAKRGAEVLRPLQRNALGSGQPLEGTGSRLLLILQLLGVELPQGARGTFAAAMKGTRWRRVPWVSLSCLCLCLLPRVVPENSNVTTPLPSTTPSSRISTKSIPHKTSSSGETTTSPHSSVSNTFLMTSQVQTMKMSTDSIPGTTGETSTTGSKTPAAVISAGSAAVTLEGQSTATSSRTSNQDISASSQNHQTKSMETTRESETGTLTQMATLTFSSSPSVHNVTETVSQETSTPGKTMTSYPSSFSNTPVMTTSTDSTLGNTEETSTLGTKSPSPLASAASITAETNGQSTAALLRTSIEEKSVFSQNHRTHSMQTTRKSQISTLTQMTTSTLSFSPSTHNVTGTVSQEATPPGETTTSSPSSFSNTPPMTTSTDSILGNTEETSTPGTKSPTQVSSVESITDEPTGQSTAPSSRTSTQDISASSQNHQSQSMETTSEAETGTLTQRSTSTLSSSPSVLNVTETASQETSSADEMTTPSPSSVTSTPMMTSKVMTMTTFTESIFNNTEETSTPGTKSPTPVPSAASITAEPEGQSAAPSSRTSTQDISASSQNHQSQSTETTSEAQASTLTQMMTSTHSSSPSVLNGMETVSQKTSPADEMTTSFPSSVTNTLMMTSETIAMTTSTDSTLGNIEETSTPGTESSTPAISAVSITAELEGQSRTTSSRTSIQDTSASSQNHQTQSIDTTRESQTSTLTQRTTSIPSFSPSVHNVKGTISQKTFPPGETTTSSLFSVTNTPMMTSKKITTTTSTDSTLGNTGETSVPVTRSLMPVTSAASITAEPEGQLPATSSRTSTQDTTGFSQNHQSQSTEITSEAQTDTLTQMMTSALPSSPSVLNVTEAVSQKTSPPDEITTSFSSSVTNTLMMTSKTITMTTSTDSTLGNTEETSTPGTESSTPVTSAVSVGAEPEGQSRTTSSRTSTQDTSDSLQNHQTQSIETTRVSQINTLTPVTTSTVLSSPSGFNPSGTVSQETFPSGETTTSSPSSVSNTFLVTSEVFRMPTSRDSTLGNTEEISLPVRGTISAITSRVSTIWLSDTLSTALSPSSLPPKISTAFHTQQSEGAETIGWPHERSSVSPGVSHETFPPHETITWPFSFSSEDRTTRSPKELPSTPTGAATRLVTGSPIVPGTAGTIPRVPSEVSTIGESGQPTTHPSHSTTLLETTGAGAQTQWTQETGTTGEVPINSPSYSVTQMINTATSPSSSPMLDGHTSQQITMVPSTNHSTIHSTNTSPQESLAVSQRGHTQAPQTTQESQTTRSISPVTDTKTVTTPGSSFTASGHSPSEIAPQDAPTISAATTFAPPPTGDGHTTQAPTTVLQAAPSSPDSTLAPSGGASLSITGALPGVVSTPGVPEGRWTSASASTSPDTAAAMTQTHQAEGTEASGETQTSEPASSGSGTTSDGTATPSSSRASSTTPSGSEGISITGETTWFSPNPSRDSHTTQSTTELLSASASHDATPVSTGMVSAIVPSTFPVTLSEASTAGRPTGQSSPTSPSASPQETAAISRIAQTQRTGTSRGSDTISLVSQATDTFSTVTPTPPSITSSGLTFPQTETHTLSPSGSGTTFNMALVSNSHGTQTTVPTSSPGTTEGPPKVSSSTLSDGASHSPSTVVSTSEGVLTTSRSSVIHETVPAAVFTPLHSGNNALTITTRVPASSVGISSTPSPEHPEATKRVTPTPNPMIRSTHKSSTSNHSGTMNSTPTSSFSPTTYLSIQTTLEASSASKYPKNTFPTPQPSRDSASSSDMNTAQTTLTFSPSSSHSPFSPAFPGPAVTSNSTTLLTGHATPLAVSSASSASTVSSGSPLKTETSGMTTTSVKTGSESGRVTSLPPTTSQTATAPSPPTTSQASTSATPSTAMHTRSTAAPAPVPVQPEKGASLLPYGAAAGDLEFVRRTVDFTSPLFRPATGFPLGSSLRDSLYFTDNGQIIFPESDYQMFSYPNPLPTGFTGWDPVALVAPFWDDADFSTGQGTIFYQEYETLYGERRLPVLQAESWIRKITNNGGFKARWTLKVTWVNAHAYPAQWTLGSNTYQAILSTDGSRSYALFLYQSGGMQWDVAQRSGNLVLMGFSSGDGYFENSPLMSQPVWEKYRPDRFLNSSSGLRGLQFYRLHREERPNYRLECLQWLKSQPQWPSWGWNQVSCPCSWQQGRWDLRFQPVSIGLLGLGSRQLCSFTSWRGGVCCSYGPWGEFREGWHVQRPWQFAPELEPQNWCCLWNDKPYLCALYQQRRPRVDCATYRPPRPAWMFGDPHITTLDGVNYTFNGLGDFLLVGAQDGNSSFLLQGRTAQTGSAQATNFIAFAAQYRSGSLDPVTVQWLLEPHDGIHVLLDNQTVTFEPGHGDGGGQETVNATGVLLSRNGSVVSASFDGWAAVSVIALSDILHASASLPPECQNRTEGLLGVWNNNPEDDFRMPNGSTVPPGSSEETLFHYGMTWQINGTGLLGKRNDQLPSNFTPVFYSQLQNSSWAEDVISSCNGDSSCIYDTLALRNASIGLHTRAVSKTYKQVNATLNQYPPSINGGRVVEAYKGQTTLIQYTSNAEDATFTLRDNCTDFKLFENGTLLWTPKSLEPFTLEILARSAKIGLASALQPRTVVCHCNAESQCLYNQTSRVGNSSLEMAGCKCDGGTFGRYCQRSKDACEEPCFPSVRCIPGKGCEACPPHLTGDGRHCAALGSSLLCRNQSCPVNYCYNQGRCYISQTLGCQPTCTCPPAFTDSLCFLAGNNFSPTVHLEPPLRVIQLLLSEEENASMAEVNASVAYILGTLDMRAFLRNSQVNRIDSPAPASGSPIQHWMVISEFQYRPWGPVIDFLNNQLLAAVVEAFLYQVPPRREESRNHVVFQPISGEDVWDVRASSF
ncbi:PREDICTED: mucin-4 isoform X2 [Cercocebus atys]|uniref:mucin-4 isoform X2 n=1 Tax=Cercocebus atys TaxID=9531 RepID=UPI0005F3D9A9|nr:PREDICTED: mucin-4 isoform X2 [Cercocebus atys]